MTIVPTMSYRGIKRGVEYKLLKDGHDYKEISVMGRAMFVPSYIFDPNNFYIEEDENER